MELKVPVESVAKLTEPSGVPTVPGELSVTVAVQDWLREEPISTQFRVVPVERWPNVSVEALLLAK